MSGHTAKLQKQIFLLLRNKIFFITIVFLTLKVMKVSLSVSHSGQLATDMSPALDSVDQVTLLKIWSGMGYRSGQAE